MGVMKNIIPELGYNNRENEGSLRVTSIYHAQTRRWRVGV